MEEALLRARHHGRNAAAEALCAARAVLDAAALATRGEPAASHPWFARASQLLDELAAELGAGGAMAQALLEAVAEALDVEIGRWEARARQDPEARAVLRAFLGLREVLWEFGVRPGDKRPAEPGRPTRAGPRATRRSRPRVQRVQVES
ncbi:MAG: hypothetical protein QNK04_23955 [Myxococcota bacterium]|nr:hypothetical protein [Myxococcota bacterium]